MTAPSLPAALRATAEGLYAFEAPTGLIIGYGTWLDRDEFADRFIQGHGKVAFMQPEAALACAAGRGGGDGWPLLRCLGRPSAGD